MFLNSLAPSRNARTSTKSKNEFPVGVVFGTSKNEFPVGVVEGIEQPEKAKAVRATSVNLFICPFMLEILLSG